MDQLSIELKQARESRKMSLTDIADLTLINIQFLQEIERGNLSFLPEAYVRAFVREYASTVGLDPEDIMRKYDGRKKEGTPSPTMVEPPSGPAQPTGQPSQPETPAAQPEPAPEPVPRPPRIGSEQRAGISPTTIRIAMTVVVILAVAVTAWNLLTPNQDAPVPEIPFDSVMKEHEERDQPPDTGSTAIPEEAPGDSLMLNAITSDSSWIKITIDAGAPIERLLRPGTRASWKAARRFMVSLGNAGAVQFTLNNKALGSLGKVGVAVHNREITREMLSNR